MELKAPDYIDAEYIEIDIDWMAEGEHGSATLEQPADCPEVWVDSIEVYANDGEIKDEEIIKRILEDFGEEIEEEAWEMAEEARREHESVTRMSGRDRSRYMDL